MSTFQDCCYEIKYKLFKTYCMDLYGCVLWVLASNSIIKVYTTWRKGVRLLLGLPYKTRSKFLHGVVNDIPVECQVHKRFLKFIVSVLKSENQIVKLCRQLALSGRRSAICNNINYIWSKYNVSMPKSDYSLTLLCPLIWMPFRSINTVLIVFMIMYASIASRSCCL